MKTADQEKPRERSPIRPGAPSPIYTPDYQRSRLPFRGRGALINMGILQIVLGIAAIVLPIAAPVYAGIFMGALILVSGLVQLYTAGKNRSLLRGLVGLIPIAAGIVILANQRLGFTFLVTIFLLYLLFSGVSRLVFALGNRSDPEWKFALVGGLYSLVLAGLILARWPGNTPVAMGLFVGTNIVFGGILNIAFSGKGKLII
jgi:uncharacterized membrane protein HdeD (DUF308 family)